MASLEAGNPPDITRLGGGYAQLYRSQGHLLEVTDLVNRMQWLPKKLQYPAATVRALATFNTA